MRLMPVNQRPNGVLDSINCQLLHELQEDARLSVAELELKCPVGATFT